MNANRWLICVGGALAFVMAVNQRTRLAEQHRAASLALGVANATALRDSTHVVARENANVARLLGDTLALFAKRVVQAAQERDVIDRALRAERIARYAMEVEVRSLHRDSVVASRDTEFGGARRAVFDVRDAPYDVHAEVEMPSAPDTARLSVRVRMDPLHLAVRLLCDTPDTNGIRAASITAETPAWATVRFDRVAQSAELCASPALAKPAAAMGHLGFTPLVIGAGRVFGGSAPSAWGLFVGAGIRVGP